MSQETQGLDQVLHPLAQQFAPADRVTSVLLTKQAERFPDKPFIILADQTYTYSDMAKRAGAAAAVLAEAGVKRGDRVALLCGNRIEFIDFFLGCAWLNAVAVPINHFARGPQLRHILSNSGTRLLIIDEEAVAALLHIEKGDVAVAETWLLPARNSQGFDVAPYAAWSLRLAPQLAGHLDPVPVKPSETAAILYTSGTTGPSKGVCCPQAQFFWWGLQSVDILEITEQDILLTSLPLFHVNALGSVYQALLAGATLVILERFSASGFSGSLRKYDATVTYLLGAMVSILLSTPPSDQDRNHRTTRTLAPGVSGKLAQEFAERYGIGGIDGYGSTETNFVIGEQLSEQKPGTMGRVRPGFSAIVVDNEDNELPVGEAGELVVRSDIPFAMSTGYFNLGDATVSAWRNLWFHTGDRVTRDEDGYFRFMDRIKDAIRRRGENISAYEVEQVLLSHPSVANAAVYPVVSELTEDEVMASIVLHDGVELPPEELLDFCKPRMTYFSVPRFVLFESELPMTENGKVQKFKLRERGVTTETWDRDKVGYKVGRGG